MLDQLSRNHLLLAGALDLGLRNHFFSRRAYDKALCVPAKLLGIQRKGILI